MLRPTVKAGVRSRASTIPSPIPATFTLPVPVVYHDRGWPKPEIPLKTPFVLRPFVKDGHLDALQRLEIRGMYREEVDIERSRFPRFQKTLVIRTDGSMDEIESEVQLPPFLLMYMDRQKSHVHETVAMLKMGKSREKLRRTWETAAQPMTTTVTDEAAPDDPPMSGNAAEGSELWNTLCFPFASPMRHVTPRAVENVNPDGESRPAWSDTAIV